MVFEVVIRYRDSHRKQKVLVEATNLASLDYHFANWQVIEFFSIKRYIPPQIETALPCKAELL